MLLNISAVAGDVSLTDPFPSEGLVPVYVPRGTSATFPVSPSQLYRMQPQLTELEARVDPVTKQPLMTWSTTIETGEDVRREDFAAQGGPVLSYMHPGSLSTGSGNVGVVLHGLNLLGSQTKAAVTVGVGAGSVVYTAIKPGSTGNNITVTHVVAGLSTTLSVAVSGTNITVNLATNGSGVATSTAANVIAAVNGAAAANVQVVATVGVAGTAQAATLTYLLAGSGPGVTLLLNGASIPYTSITDTALTFTVLTAQMTGTAATDIVGLTVVAGLQELAIHAVVAA